MSGYQTIYQRYKQQILNGQLKPGDKVASIRVLAADLGVAKKTVETAYSILIGEGYLVSQGAHGTRVNPDLKLQRRPPPDNIAVADHELQQLIDIRDNAGHFRLGIPSLDAFPYKKWLLLAAKAVRAMRPEHMLIPPVMGHQPLRQAIANYVNISRGLNCSPHQVCITSGYKQSLALILQTLAAPQDKVVYEDPGYFFGHKLLQRIAKNLHYAPVDRDGINVDYLLKHHQDARFVIITPAHHSPLAVTLSLPRRQQLLNWAQTRQAWIIEDDYDGEFHYSKKVLPALKSQDPGDRVIYVGTFSKTIMPAMRTSYIVLPKKLVNRFHETAEIVATGLPLLPQQILSRFIAEGHFFKHLKKMRSLYQARRQMVLNALHQVYPQRFYVELSDGGMHLVAFLKSGSQDQQLAELWQQHQLLVSPLSLWYAGKTKRYGLVIGYTNITSEQEAITAFKRPYQQTVALLNG
ncbi:PLP-dependent aminotransferase family protein [Idiomarina xiamenensis]|uniref:Transcriptional regulator n=1 Tax=Idiomarina xiamenensis 10-D-4 TaxID=740709 RepID=K2K9B5_9GAMM|nr:PLP-dependent aminotransferase family protein [Idiomarina xiamenensis]EKE84378.1 transcriptional regulator [Idiomarina xiamenensis 10-D-4]